MKNLKEVLYIFCGLSIIFILIYFAEHSKRKPVDFDVIAKRAMAWRTVIESLHTTVPRQGSVVRYLCPIEEKKLRRLSLKGGFYDKWFTGGKDYTDFWRYYNDPENRGYREQLLFVEEGTKDKWFLNEASFADDMKSHYINGDNYPNIDEFESAFLGDPNEIISNSASSLPFIIDRLVNAKLVDIKKEEFSVMHFVNYLQTSRYSVDPSLLGTYELSCFFHFHYRDVKQPDLSEMNKRYQRNLDLISEKKSGLDKQVLAGLENINQAEELPVAETCDSKTLAALSEVLKLLEKAGIKEVHSLTVLPENPAREYLCIPVKINAILTYDQLKGLSDAVGSASILSIINFFAVTNCDLKMTDVKPLIEKGLPFYQARCMVIIEFITGLPDKM